VHNPKPSRQQGRYLHTGSAQWRAIRKAQLEQFPLCADCGQPANEVDHIEGDTSRNVIGVDLASLCKPCHSLRTSGGDRNRGCDANGNPLDPNHHWNRERSLGRFDSRHVAQPSRTRPQN
jgi:5-methylcytosine-specific restriction endonuclease McrA